MAGERISRAGFTVVVVTGGSVVEGIEVVTGTGAVVVVGAALFVCAPTA